MKWLQDAPPIQIVFVIGLVVAGFAMVVGVFGDSPVDDSEPAAVSASPSPDPSPSPSPEPSPTEVALDEATEEVTEPEEVVASEEYELTEEDMRTLAFPIVFDSGRENMIGLLEDMFVVESVDRFVYDEESGTVQLSITPAYDFDEGVRDDAWEIMRGFSELYTEDTWLEPTRTFVPSLEVDISTANYLCDGETMIAIAEARLSREEWDAACRVE